MQRNTVNDDHCSVDLSTCGIEVDEIESVSIPSPLLIFVTILIHLQRSIRGVSEYGHDLYIHCVEECGYHLLTRCSECFQS